MKKTYQNPETIVVTLKTVTHLLTQSQVDVGNEYNGETVLSRRRGSNWDNENDDY